MEKPGKSDIALQIVSIALSSIIAIAVLFATVTPQVAANNLSLWFAAIAGSQVIQIDPDSEFVASVVTFIVALVAGIVSTLRWRWIEKKHQQALAARDEMERRQRAFDEMLAARFAAMRSPPV